MTWGNMMMSKKTAATRLPSMAACLCLYVLLAGCKWFRHPSIDPMSFKEYQYHVVEIDTAEAIKDPVDSCIAYPNPPEFKWSSNLVRLMCEDARRPATPVSMVRRLIDQKDWSGLDNHYAELVRRHHSGEDPEGLLYRSFPVAAWKDDAEEDSYTLKWLKGSPKSAYAQAERGLVLLRRAWLAKEQGDAEGNEVEGLKIAMPIAVEATALLRAAGARDPRLMPTYRGRLSAAILMRKTGEMEAILREAEAQSPHNYYVRDQFMQALEPEWFGSFDDMDAFSERVRPYVRKNPRLLILVARADSWKGDRYLSRGWYGNALDQYREGLASAPEESVLFTAANIAYREGHYAQAMMYWSQVIRFSRVQAGDALYKRAGAWEKLDEGSRAYCDYKSALALEPSDEKRLRAVKMNEDFYRSRNIDYSHFCGPGNAQAKKLRRMLGLK